MPVITNAGGGGGAGSDECTLTKANVPIGLKAVTADSDDEAVEGILNVESSASDSHVLDKQTYFKFNFASDRWERRTGSRKNNGALNATLNCGESYTIPAGDTTGGKVTANSLASQTPGTAVAADIMAGKTATVNGVRITGIKVNHGTINATLNCGQSRVLPAGSIDGGTITAASLASQTGGVTAEDGYVYTGKTYWRDGVKRTGNMSVNSVLSFSAAAYGGKQILLKWQNPYAANGKPFSGVVITRSTGGYPGTGGEWIYQGAGNNTAPGGWSQVVLAMPALGTGYYFSVFPYVTCSAGTMYGNVINAYAATAAELWLTFTSSQSYIIPEGYSKMDAFVVGGGGGAVDASPNFLGCGGGSGFTNVIHGIGASPGENISIVVGLGGSGTGSGSSSSVSKSSGQILSAKGGFTGDYTTVSQPPGLNGEDGKGGSGGGRGKDTASGGKIAGRGGSDGSRGYGLGTSSDIDGGLTGGSGQRTTTRAWGSGTLYAGGGGGGNRYGPYNGFVAGSGGDGGGGNGGLKDQSGSNGSPNTGGGAGAGGSGSSSVKSTSGGSGIVLLHIY